MRHHISHAVICGITRRDVTQVKWIVLRTYIFFVSFFEYREKRNRLQENPIRKICTSEDIYLSLSGSIRVQKRERESLAREYVCVSFPMV